jgi:hypothetical protein
MEHTTWIWLETALEMERTAWEVDLRLCSRVCVLDRLFFRINYVLISVPLLQTIERFFPGDDFRTISVLGGARQVEREGSRGRGAMIHIRLGGRRGVARGLARRSAAHEIFIERMCIGWMLARSERVPGRPWS